MLPRILAFAGSLPPGIVQQEAGGNRRQGRPRRPGPRSRSIDLRDFPLPLFDQDLEAEQGIPENGAGS